MRLTSEEKISASDRLFPREKRTFFLLFQKELEKVTFRGRDAEINPLSPSAAPR